MSDAKYTEEDVEVYRDALDHIMRTAKASRTQSRRDRWIASRAESALNDTTDWKNENYPVSVNSCEKRNLKLKIENKELGGRVSSLEDALRPFSYFACSPLGECTCNNCEAARLLNNNEN